MIEIGNYAMLRRHVGARRAETLAADIVATLIAMEPSAIARVGGRDLIEIEITGSSRAVLDDLLADCTTLFAEPLAIDAEPYLVEVVLGAAAAKVGECDEVRLLEEAEHALADARAEHRPIVRDATRTIATIDRIALARELPEAIRDDDLFLQYQPKLHIRRQEVNSLEALIRWRHPMRGLVLPGDFIPLAEQSRDIGPLTLWTIRRVIEDQRRLAAAGHELRVFINIAGVLLTDSAFVRQACALVQAGGTAIGFEITETSVIRDPQSAIAHLNVFADIGIVIAIDDYGAGLSSLAYLKQLPARELKIDKLFVTQLTSSNRDPLIVRSTIDLAHALEMEVVAEGVETPAALALLSVMGCDMAQGFLISRPVGLDAIVTFLREQAEGTRTIEPAAIVQQLRRGWAKA
ncbi:MAG: EAL domain-containing protein [Lysobacteraceae bacterium]|nr:MAG: EAL domain-containing protein [Xanthomonadaceae bacterium]